MRVTTTLLLTRSVFFSLLSSDRVVFFITFHSILAFLCHWANIFYINRIISTCVYDSTPNRNQEPHSFGVNGGACTWWRWSFILKRLTPQSQDGLHVGYPNTLNIMPEFKCRVEKLKDLHVKAPLPEKNGFNMALQSSLNSSLEWPIVNKYCLLLSIPPTPTYLQPAGFNSHSSWNCNNMPSSDSRPVDK
ncbi:hypothetical protein VNO80_25422 [Phaseolus coccineus]|uniref:Uncharacterized protein n=1 Tax=Phaseolus coccineus TaxID=3886 RepID=A0AAN9QTC5_PHACN